MYCLRGYKERKDVLFFNLYMFMYLRGSGKNKIYYTRWYTAKYLVPSIEYIGVRWFCEEEKKQLNIEYLEEF